MLSMKTLKVAIVTMGSALLLGPSLAAAVDIQLDGKGDNAASPVMYAAETLPVADAMGGYLVAYPGGNLDLHVKPRRRIEETEDVFLRLELNGVTIGGVPQLIAPTLNADGAVENENAQTSVLVSSGGAMSKFVVFPVGAVALGSTVGVRLQTNGMLGATSGTFSASISSYSDPDDALDGEFASSAFGGSATIIRLVSGVTTIIKAAPSAATASVATGFQRFTGDFSNAGGGQATLGWLGVEEKVVPQNNPDELPITYHSDGDALADDDIITDTGKIAFNVMGNLDIGAFTTNPEPDTFDRKTLEGSVGCTANAAETVDRGTFVDGEGDMLIGEEGERPSGVESASTGLLDEGLYVVCVNVDVMGPTTNMTAIPEATYAAAAHIKRNSGANTPLQMVGEEGAVGAIERDGASVNIPYLTTSTKHNQRLIIVNRGTSAVGITSVQFNSEDGTEVELMPTVQGAMDAGLLMIPGGQTWVARMDQTLNITGDSRRTAATIAFAGTKGALSVATTQVNFSDDSTDTVVYTVK